jgi:hypothetical protein
MASLIAAISSSEFRVKVMMIELIRVTAIGDRTQVRLEESSLSKYVEDAHRTSVKFKILPFQTVGEW